MELEDVKREILGKWSRISAVQGRTENYTFNEHTIIQQIQRIEEINYTIQQKGNQIYLLGLQDQEVEIAAITQMYMFWIVDSEACGFSRIL